MTAEAEQGYPETWPSDETPIPTPSQPALHSAVLLTDYEAVEAERDRYRGALTRLVANAQCFCDHPARRALKDPCAKCHAEAVLDAGSPVVGGEQAQSGGEGGSSRDAGLRPTSPYGTRFNDGAR